MNIENYGDVWKTLAALMLELELPMLKGRSRLAYAEEKSCSPWSVGMISENFQETKNTKKTPYVSIFNRSSGMDE